MGQVDTVHTDNNIVNIGYQCSLEEERDGYAKLVNMLTEKRNKDIK